MKKRSRDPRDLLQLIEKVYAAAVDDRCWEGLAPQISDAFLSSSTTLQVQGRGRGSTILSVTENVRSRVDAYRAHYWQRDIWVQRASELVGMSRVAASKDMVSDSEFQESEFYRDWCRYLDVFYVVGSVFPTGAGELGVLGIHRPKSAGTYTDSDKSLVGLFLPHLQRALRIRDHLARAALYQRVSLEALNRSGTAILLVTAEGFVVYANTLAEKMLRDGTGICSRHGRLSSRRIDESERLSLLIGQASSLSAGGIGSEGTMAVRRASQWPLSLLVAPFRIELTGIPTPGAIVFVRDPCTQIAIGAAVQALFRMTPTEARISEALVNGQTLDEIARKHGATRQTVRKQLKAVFAKTGTKRQAECVSLLLRCVAPVVHER